MVLKVEEVNLKNKYRDAFSEVLYIIENLNEVNKSKISEKFIKFLERNRSQDYIVNLPKDVIKHPELLKRETKIILALMYRDYFCTQEEKEKLDKKFIDNNEKYEEELREKYNPDNIFKNINKSDKSQENANLIKYEEPKWYKKIFLFIGKVLGK